MNELAGDFDADGKVDIGADSPMYAFGGSLGGIMSTVLGAVEPSIEAIAPISGGGGYGDMGPRSTQGGVYEGFILRAMGPLFVGTPDEETGDLLLETIVVDVNSDETFTLARIPDVQPWDTMLVENLRNGVRRCAFVQTDGTVRAASETDVGDPLRITFFRGPQLVAGNEHCELLDGAESYAVVGEFTELIKTDVLGGKSAAIFPYNRPEGQHGFDLPGGMTDKARRHCADTCTLESDDDGEDPCSCEQMQTFDIGFFMLNMVGRYFASGGMELSDEACMSSNDCPGLPAAPATRDTATLP